MSAATTTSIGDVVGGILADAGIDSKQVPKFRPRPPVPKDGRKCSCGRDLDEYDVDACCICVRNEQSRRRELECCLEHIEDQIPKFYRGAVLEQCVCDAKALAKAKTAVKADRVALIGPAGSGKTTIAISIAREWAKLGKRVNFITARRLALARSQAPLGDGEAEEVTFAMTTKRAIIDDVGSEAQHPTSAVSDVIDARFSEGRPTIITCALDIDGIKARYGDGIARRVFERAIVIDVKPKGAR